MGTAKVVINRAPVLTLWAAIVAERSGHAWTTALSLGKTVAGLNVQAKRRHLGIFTSKEPATGETKPKTAAPVEWVTVCGRPVPVRATADGLRAVSDESVVDPESVTRYLEKAFGESLGDVLVAKRELARAFPPAEIEARA